jgi:integrase
MTSKTTQGSVYFDRRKNRWIGIIDLGTGPEGKRRRQRVYGTTESEATRLLAKLVHDLETGRPSPDGAMRFEAFFERWLRQTIEPNARSLNTFDHYEVIVRRHLVPAFGKKRLRDLTVDDVEQLLSAKYDAGYSDARIRRIRMVLVKGLRDAERKDLVVRNVAALTDLRRCRVREGRSLTEQEARNLLVVAKGERLELAVHLGLQLGLRPGEVLGLTWENVDFSSGTLTVRQSLKLERGRLLLGEVKTPTSRRCLSMPPTLSSLLSQHQSKQEEERELAGDLWHNLNLVNATQVGTPIHPSNYRRDLRMMCDRAGINYCTPNQLRHSYASIMSSKGVALEEISDAMGHVDTRMTSLVYRHRLNPIVSSTAGPMEALFGSTLAP